MRRGLIALLLVVLGACGVPSSDGASTAVGQDVPYGLLDDVVSTTTVPERVTEEVSIWLVADGLIVPVTREVARPATLDDALAALADGPTPGEATLGLRSAVTADSVAGASRALGVVTLDLRTAFAASTPREQLLALAQLVHTATGIDDVEVVTFTLDGQSIDVPRADGSISEGPVTRLDYAQLVTDAPDPS